MTELVDRNLSARTIRKQLEFTLDEQFNQRLIREIRTRLDHLHNAWTNFRRTHAIVVDKTNDQADLGVHESLYDEIELAFLDASARMQERIHQTNEYELSEIGDENDRHEAEAEQMDGDETIHQPNISMPSHSSAPTIRPAAPLNYQVPQIIVHCGNKKVEKTWSDFDGNPTQWQGFHDLYKSAVHDNPALTVAEKFAQLKVSLKGKAAAALGDYQLTDQNYQEAWNRLKDLYQCDYTTSKELLWKFNNLPVLKYANATMIQRFSNVTHQVLRQLKAMNYPTEHYDLMFVHSLHDKLDEDSSYEWGTTRQSERPTIYEMLAFLDRRAKHLSNAKHSQHHSGEEQRKRHSSSIENRKDNKRSKSSSANEQKATSSNNASKCKVCNKEQHPVHRCPKFIKMELAARRNAAKEHNLCYNCLSTQHTSKDCKSSTCKRCDKKHNSLLCNANPINKSTNVAQPKQQHKSKSDEPKEPKS